MVTYTLGWFVIITSLQLLLLYVGLKGAAQRKRKLLRAYSTINITLIMLGIFFTLLILFFPQQAPIEELEPPPNNTDNSNQTEIYDIEPLPVNQNDTVGIGPEPETSQGVSFFILFFWFFGLLTFFVKLLSIILASKMARMLHEKELHELAHPIMSKRQPSIQPVYVPVTEEMPEGYFYSQQPIFYAIPQQPTHNPYIRREDV